MRRAGLRAIALVMSVFAVFTVQADPIYKAGKFNCVFIRIRPPKNEKNLTLESTKEKPGNYYYEGVEFITKVAEDNLVTLGARFGNIQAKPYAETYGKNSAWITIVYGPDSSGIAVTARCELVGDGN
jgi:hypothetical protein